MFVGASLFFKKRHIRLVIIGIVFHERQTTLPSMPERQRIGSKAIHQLHAAAFLE